MTLWTDRYVPLISSMTEDMTEVTFLRTFWKRRVGEVVRGVSLPA